MRRNPVRKATRQSTGKQIDPNKIDQICNQLVQSAPRISRDRTLAAIKSFSGDDDLEVTGRKLSLLCPLSKTRIRIAVKGSKCSHLDCFDLRSFLEYRTQMSFLECPFSGCNEKVDLNALCIEEYVNEILGAVPANISEVILRKDGSYFVAQATAGAVDVKIEDETPFVAEDLPPLKFEPDEPAPPASAEASVDFETGGANTIDAAAAYTAGVKEIRQKSFEAEEKLSNTSGEVAQIDNDGQNLIEPTGVDLPTKKRFVCAKCGNQYERRGRYITHITKLCGKPRTRLPCTECHFVTDCKSHLKVHMRIHTGERPHRCAVCGAGFAQKNGLKKHMTIHAGERPFACEHCPKRFRTADILRDHVRTHIDERPYKCKQCDKSFRQIGHLNEHVTSHLEARNFNCDRCPQSFKYKVHLTRHQRIHDGTLACSKEGCKYVAATGSALRVHQAIHSEDRPFVCSQCEMRFKFYTGMKSHEQTHGPRRHKCTICSYATVWSQNLKNHMLQHTDIRQHRCDQCPASYNRKDSLMIHKKKHEPDAYLKCDACNFRTTAANHMKRHLQTPKHLKNHGNAFSTDNEKDDVSADADDSDNV